MSNKLTLHKDYRKLYKKYKYKYLGLKNMIGGTYVLGKTLSEDMARQIGSFNTNVKVFAGSDHTMIMKTDRYNDTVKVFACGKNYDGQLGLPELVPGKTYTFTEVTLEKGVVPSQVVAGESHTMILAQDGTVFACGHNLHGQLGLPDDTILKIFTFTQVPALPDGVVVAQIVAGDHHTMIRAKDGRVFACGYNNYGQLGLGHFTPKNEFTSVNLPKDVLASQVVAGSNHTMILAEDGRVFACGLNNYGHLGLGDNNLTRTTFTAVTLPEDVVTSQIVAGAYHTMILAKNGTVFACGTNQAGELGLGDTTRTNKFTSVTLPEDVFPSQVVAGRHHTMIIGQDGTVFACGYNRYGQLGLDDEENKDTFTAVPALPEGVVAAQVIAGSNHTMIIAKDGTVFACGKNDDGQLGLGDYENRNTFTPVPALPNEGRLRNASDDNRDE